MSEFWLPPEFFTDEDNLMDSKKTQNRGKDPVYGKTPFDYNSNSGLFSSSDESGTSEESEEEESLTGLTWKLGNSTLSHDSWKTEAGMKCLCGCKPDSGNRIFPEDARKAAEWEFLLAAAREIKRKRQMEDVNEYYQSMGLKPVSQPPDAPLSHEQLQIAKIQQMKREHLMKQQQEHWMKEQQEYLMKEQQEHLMKKQQKHLMKKQQEHLMKQHQERLMKQPQEHLMKQQQAMAVDARSRHMAQPPRAKNLNLSKSSWPTSQQSLQPPHQLPHQRPIASSGMRAVILGNAGSKREAAGTGVFLPHSAGSVTEPPKKSGSATVLLPDRMVQALNLNLEAMDSQSRFSNALTSDLDAAGYMPRNVPMGPQHKQNIKPTSAMTYTDLGLPQDWTY